MARDFVFLEGLAEAQKAIKILPIQIERAGIQGAARKAAQPVILAARVELNKIGKRKSEKDEDFSKSLFAARFIKAVAKRRSALPGVRVLFKGPDIPMNDGKSRSINIGGYAAMMAEGSYVVKKRSHKSGKNTGEFKGFGNFIDKAWDRVSSTSIGIFKRNLLTEMDKAIDRSIKRTSKKLI